MRTVQNVMLVAGVALLAAGARADLKVVQSTTIDNPQLKASMQNMSPQQRAQMAKIGMGGAITSTTYARGNQARVDYGVNSIIINGATKQMTTINRVSHTYSTSAYDPNAGRGGSLSAKPTGKTKVILGHLCRDYRISLTGANGSVTSGDIWAAADLPQSAANPLISAFGVAQNSLSKIKGFPLQTTVTSSSQFGQTTIRAVVKSVSTGPVSPSLFAIPAGYKPGPASFGAGMGGGMGR